MLKLAVFITVLFVGSAASAANYYFDATGGSDANPCTSAASPCKTINKLNTLTFASGDTFHFLAGEQWNEDEKITVGATNVTFTCYKNTSGDPCTPGVDTFPIISGARSTSRETVTWCASTVDSSIYYLEGDASCGDADTNPSIEDEEPAGSGNFIWRLYWESDRSDVESERKCSGGTQRQCFFDFHCSSFGEGDCQHAAINTTDLPDEHWTYGDADSLGYSTIYLRSTDGTPQDVYIPQTEHNIVMTDKSGFSIENLVSEMSAGRGLFITGGSGYDVNDFTARYNCGEGFRYRMTSTQNYFDADVFIDDSVFSYNGSNGAEVIGNFNGCTDPVPGDNFTITDSEFDYNWQDGVQLFWWAGTAPTCEDGNGEDNVKCFQDDDCIGICDARPNQRVGTRDLFSRNKVRFNGQPAPADFGSGVGGGSGLNADGGDCHSGAADQDSNNGISPGTNGKAYRAVGVDGVEFSFNEFTDNANAGMILEFNPRDNYIHHNLFEGNVPSGRVQTDCHLALSVARYPFYTVIAYNLFVDNMAGDACGASMNDIGINSISSAPADFDSEGTYVVHNTYDGNDSSPGFLSIGSTVGRWLDTEVIKNNVMHDRGSTNWLVRNNRPPGTNTPVSDYNFFSDGSASSFVRIDPPTDENCTDFTYYTLAQWQAGDGCVGGADANTECPDGTCGTLMTFVDAANNDYTPGDLTEHTNNFIGDNTIRASIQSTFGVDIYAYGDYLGRPIRASAPTIGAFQLPWSVAPGSGVIGAGSRCCIP